MKYFKLRPGVSQIYDMASGVKILPGQVVGLNKIPNSPRFKRWLREGVILPSSEEEYLKTNKPEEYEAFLASQAKEEEPLTDLSREELEELTKEELIEEFSETIADEEEISDFKKLKKGDMVNKLLGL